MANTTAKKARGKGKPFAPGNNANPAGRPKGSRNKIAEDFIHAMSADFEKHGIAVIQRVRTDKPDVYLKLVADLVPKEIGLKHDASEALMALLRANS